MPRPKTIVEESAVKEGKLFSFKLDGRLAERVEHYLESQNSIVKFKSQLINLAIARFLDREEIIAREIDKERSRIEKII
ncbi:MAG: hypothetical protein IH613_13335 [Desulfuromonadales bacterium]|nr:hypothetical protein [Desulfuromonadales bacterium]